MADRYAVISGATANWSDVNIWSDADGGTTGKSVPASGDNVYFTAATLSGICNLTIDTNAEVGAIDFSALDNVLTITNTQYTFSIFGNLTEHATNLAWAFSGTGYMYIKGNCTITTNGKASHTLNKLYIEGVGITVTHADNFNGGATWFYITSGHWNTNNFNITSTGYLILQTGTKTISFGSSTITFLHITSYYGWGTFNAGTSTIVTTGGSGLGSYLSTGNYYNVTGYNFSIWGTCTFNNLTVTKPTSGQTGNITFGEYGVPVITINGTWTVSGYDSSVRFDILSSVSGTQRTITAENILFSNINIRDINLQGNCVKDLSAIAGGAVDLGNNSNIRFSPSLKNKGRGSMLIGKNKKANAAVQIGDQVWSAKNYNESVIGSLTIPEIQNATNTEVVTPFDFTTWGTVGLVTGRTINSFTTSGSGGVRKDNLMIPNRYYKITAIGTATDSFIIGDTYGNPNSYYSITPTAGSFNDVKYFKWTGSGVGNVNFYIRTFIADTITFTTLTVELIGWASMDTIPTASERVGWCNYNNLQANGDVYGKLYNWWAVNEINNQLIALNSDWRVPTSTQFAALSTYLGGDAVSGGKLKELGLAHWNSPNTKGSNSSGFNLLGSGVRSHGAGAFTSLTTESDIWTITEDSATNATSYFVTASNVALNFQSNNNKKYGFALRLIKK